MKKLYEEFEKLSGKFEEGVYYGQYNKDIEFLTAYHTSVLRENLINWYPISKEDSILVISSGLGALIPYLCKNAGTVTVLESSSANCYAIEKRCINFPNIILHNIDFMEFKTLARFDYIIAIDYFIKFQATFLGQYTIIDFLEKASLYLSETGKLLLACNNKMGLKYFNGAFPNISNTSLFDSFNNINFFSKAELESAFNVCGFKKYKFYYPFPDYAFPRSIFTDDSIKELEFGHHYNDYPLDRYQFFDEFKMYHELQKNGVVNIFSNSFLIELSNDMHYDNEIIFAKNQYFIDKKHKAATILYKGTLKLAEKKSLTKESAEYLKKLYDDSLILNRGEHCFKYIKYSFDESKHILKMPYIDGPSISNELEEKLVLLLKTEKECYKKDILRIFKGIYTKMLTEAVIVSPTQIFCKEFRDIFGDETIDQELYCLNPVTLDLHVDHIYRKEDDYEVIDIDPIKFLNVPVQYLIWCIIESWHYTYIFKNSQAELLIDIENIYANFGITEGMLTVFKEWRNNVYKNELAVSQIQPFYSQTYQPSFLAYKDINKFGIHSNNDSRVMAAMKRNLTVNYQITKLTPIILYGAAAVGRLFYRIFMQMGYNILGFIDKRYDEIHEIEGKKVWGIHEIPQDSNIVIVIAIKNVFEHEKIAKELYHNGYKRLVFRPQKILNGENDDALNLINQTYDYIESFKWENSYTKDLNLNYNIPEINDFAAIQLKDTAIIEENEEFVIAHIPIMNIFTAQQELLPDYPWAELSVIMLLPHTALYKYLWDGGEDKTNWYIDFCSYGALNNNIEITDRWKKNLIDNRLIVLSAMLNSLEKDFSFFYRNPPEGLWNVKQKYFNLNGGRHRAALFVYRNYYTMPLKITKDAYNKYINIDVIKKIEEYLNNNSIDILPTTIAHPYFLDFPVKKPQYYQCIIKTIIEHLANHELSINSIINLKKYMFYLYSDDCGELKRLFYKMRIGIKNLKKADPLELLFDELFYVDQKGSIDNDYSIPCIFLDLCIQSYFTDFIDTIRTCKKVFILAKEEEINNLCKLLITHEHWKEPQILKQCYWESSRISLILLEKGL